MVIIQKYIEFKADPDHDKKDDSFFCTEVGVSLSDLKAEKKRNPKWAERALNSRRDNYAEKMVEIDRGLFIAAKNGDTKAADLIYRRFDGWNPKIVAQTNHFYNFADLVASLKTEPRRIVRRDNVINEN